MQNKILAVVVTYNRLELLKRCFNALQQQTFKDFDILIVNNGSTDGTKEWIDSLPDTILKIHQSNLGGAGGFYAGQKYGYDNCYEWVWMMDDDGVPNENQLEILYRVCNDNNIKLANPLVVDIENPKQLALTDEPVKKFQRIGITRDSSCPFNGTFIHRNVICTIGFIKKEMFIWGDEVEYRQRAKNAGFEMMTITEAIHLHPKMRTTYAYSIPFCKKFKIKIKPTHFSHYFYRNLGYFNNTYARKKVLYADWFSYFIYFVRTFNFSEAKKFMKYYRKGIKHIFD